MTTRRGNLFVISAPSGSGKTTLVRRLLDALDDVRFSISFTTRPVRGSERDGIDYHFVDESVFRAKIEDGEFLEWAEVHGNYYGTSKIETEKVRAAGEDILLDVDVQGGHSIKQLMPDAVLILVEPPSMEELERRLRGRGSDSEETVRRRLAKAREELARAGEYDHVVTNRVLEAAVDEIQTILARERGGEGPPRV